jgi:hypothetical protein
MAHMDSISLCLLTLCYIPKSILATALCDCIEGDCPPFQPKELFLIGRQLYYECLDCAAVVLTT